MTKDMSIFNPYSKAYRDNEKLHNDLAKIKFLPKQKFTTNPYAKQTGQQLAKQAHKTFWSRVREKREQTRKDAELDRALARMPLPPQMWAKPKFYQSKNPNEILNQKWGNLPWPKFWEKKRTLERFEDITDAAKRVKTAKTKTDKYYRDLLNGGKISDREIQQRQKHHQKISGSWISRKKAKALIRFDKLYPKR